MLRRDAQLWVEVGDVREVDGRAVLDGLEAAARVEVTSGRAGVVGVGDWEGRGCGETRRIGAAGRGLVGCEDGGEGGGARD
jgi:hypothetical protein